MRVAIDAFLLLSPATGIARYIRELAAQLMAMPGMELHLHYALRWSRELRAGPVPRIGSLKAAFKRAVPAPYEVLRALRQAAFSVGTARRRIELYHAPAFVPLRFAGPTVITVHDLSFLRYPQAHSAAMVRALERRLPQAIAASRFVLVDSEFVRGEVLATYGVAPEKVVTTHLGVSASFRPMSETQTRPVLERHGLRHGKYVLSVGTLEPRKNLAGALEAHGLLPAALRAAYPLAVAGMTGWGGGDLKERFPDGVRRIGYVPEKDLPGLYAGAAAFLYPSIYEGFGLPVLEAFACAVPVVTSDRSSLKELAAGHAATADPHDHAALSAALREALERPPLVQARLARALEWARSFTWARCAQSTLSVYRRALAQA
jgi:alpha-1,3-rhamnosyl/mannosyltransferase